LPLIRDPNLPRRSDARWTVERPAPETWMIQRGPHPPGSVTPREEARQGGYRPGAECGPSGPSHARLRCRAGRAHDPGWLINRSPKITLIPQAVQLGNNPNMAFLVVVTGPPGAGKSTVARALAEKFEPSVLVAGDAFFAFLAGGATEPWLPAAHRQNEVLIR